VSLITALVLPFVLGRWSPLVSLGLWLALWIVAASVVSLVDRVRHAAAGAGVWARLTTTPRAYYGMLLAHLGVAVFVVGVTLVKGYEAEKDVRMQVNETVELNGFVFRMTNLMEVKGPNYVAARATMEVSRDGKSVTRLYPEKRVYTVQQMPMTEAAIDPGLTRDLYVSLGDQLDHTTWLVRVQVKPFVDWIWGGCVIMALGGLLAAGDRRYRVAARGRREAEYAEALAKAGASVSR
jgi:cytochrome c-type biogenesis protein CcmF